MLESIYTKSLDIGGLSTVFSCTTSAAILQVGGYNEEMNALLAVIATCFSHQSADVDVAYSAKLPLWKAGDYWTYKCDVRGVPSQPWSETLKVSKVTRGQDGYNLISVVASGATDSDELLEYRQDTDGRTLWRKSGKSWNRALPGELSLDGGSYTTMAGPGGNTILRMSVQSKELMSWGSQVIEAAKLTGSAGASRYTEYLNPSLGNVLVSETVSKSNLGDRYTLTRKLAGSNYLP